MKKRLTSVFATMCLLLLTLASCYSPNPGGTAGNGDVNGNDDSDNAAGSSQSALAQPGSAGSVSEAPLAFPTAPAANFSADQDASIYICGEMSMMGFADWHYESIYETAFSALADVLALSARNVNYYRYDAYGADQDAASLGNADAAKAAIRNPSFYASRDIEWSAIIPADGSGARVRGVTKAWNKDSSSGGEPETQSAEPFALANAIKCFRPDALNIAVTDLYELRNGGSQALNALKDYDVGLLAINSEFSGLLPNFTSAGDALLWGSPPTVAFAGDAAERRLMERHFFMIFAGKSDDIASLIPKIEAQLNAKYVKSSAVMLTMASLSYNSRFSDAVADRASESISFGDGGSELFYDLGADAYPDAYAYEVRAADSLPPLSIAVGYRQNAAIDARALTNSDFFVETLASQKQGDDWLQSNAVAPALSVRNVGGAGSAQPNVELALAYDFDGLAKGTYVFESRVSIKPPSEPIDTESLSSWWGLEIDEGSLLKLLKDYNSGDAGVKEIARQKLMKTFGLASFMEQIFPKAPATEPCEIYAVRVYLEVA